MSAPGHYRKKPVVIEAVQFEDDSNGAQVAAWCGGTFRPGTTMTGRIEIGTLEGTMYADHGDWIIRGVAGEHYPCKPEIFKATYEQVTSP